MKKLSVVALLFLLAALPANALDLGDPAAPITPGTWITGTPADPTVVDGKAFHLVEVWSVTCPPCVQTVPILNDLQKRYADQGFKIVSFTSDGEEDVRAFLDRHPMEYSSFIDKEGESTVQYMAADNRNTIPHAFLFDKTGALVWIGNPLDNLEARIKDVLSGRLDKEFAITLRDAREEFQDAVQSQDIEGMLASLANLEKLEPDNFQYYQAHFHILTEFGAGDEKDARAVLDRWYENVQDKPEGLIVLSMMALERGHPSMRNPAMALAAARRAYSLDSPGKLQAGLTLAEIYKEVGRLDLAIGTLGEVKGLAEDSSQEEILVAIEDFYRTLQEAGENPEAGYKTSGMQ